MFAACFALALAACGGGGGGSAITPPGAAPPATGGQPSSSVTYVPHATVYPQNYTQFWQCTGFPCGQPAPPIPFGPLAANAAGTTFYFHDENYGTVELNHGTWSAYVSHTYNDNGTSVTSSNNSWAIGPGDLAYTVGTAGNQLYIVSYANAPSGQTFTAVPDASFDLEASAIPGRVFTGGTSGLIVVDGANTASSSVHTIALPTTNDCAFRIIEGANDDVDVSNCEGFNQIFRYSKNLQLLASATVSNASHINEIAPDPDGGVWFADDVSNIFGKMSASGQVTEYPLPAGMLVSAVATASDGSIWISLGNSTGGYLGRVSETGTVTTFALPKGLQQAEYLRGTYGDPSCTPNRLYFLDEGGSIGVIDLNPS